MFFAAVALLVLSFLLDLPGRRFLTQLFHFISFSVEIAMRCATNITNDRRYISKDFGGGNLPTG